MSWVFCLLFYHMQPFTVPSFTAMHLTGFLASFALMQLIFCMNLNLQIHYYLQISLWLIHCRERNRKNKLICAWITSLIFYYCIPSCNNSYELAKKEVVTPRDTTSSIGPVFPSTSLSLHFLIATNLRIAKNIQNLHVQLIYLP